MVVGTAVVQLFVFSGKGSLLSKKKASLLVTELLLTNTCRSCNLLGLKKTKKTNSKQSIFDFPWYFIFA